MNDRQNNRRTISRDGIRNWADLNDRIRTYFRLDQDEEIALRLHVEPSAETSIIKVTVGEHTKNVELNAQMEYIDAGSFRIASAGYHFIELQGLDRSGEVFAEVNGIELRGIDENTEIVFVREDFYWGQRGPSVHLTYETPENRDIEWFYNEITVPEGEIGRA